MGLRAFLGTRKAEYEVRPTGRSRYTLMCNGQAVTTSDRRMTAKQAVNWAAEVVNSSGEDRIPDRAVWDADTTPDGLAAHETHETWRQNNQADPAVVTRARRLGMLR